MTHRTSIKSDTVSDLPASKSPTVGDLTSAKSFTVNDLAPKNESRADLYRRVEKEAAARKKEERDRRAWKKDFGQWRRRVELNSAVTLVLTHPLGERAAYEDMSFSIKVGKSDFTLSLPHRELHKLAELLRGACLHDKRMQNKAVMESLYERFN